MSQQPPGDNPFTFEVTPFGPVFCRRLNDMRLRGELCDMELVGGGDADRVEISAHKNVLMASSPYFEGMFNNGFEEHKEQRIEIKGVTGASLSTIVEYMYTGKINGPSSVRDLMHTASMLLFDDIKDACGKYLSSSVSDSTCVDLLSIGSRYNCQEMIDVASKHIKRNFKRISSSGALREVDREMVTLLLKADDLTGGEKAVYEFLIDWVRADPETRADQLPSLLSHVRMPLLGNMFILEKVGSEPLITGDPRCSEIYINSLKYCTAAATCPEAAGRYGSACWGQRRTSFSFAVSGKQWTTPGKMLAKRKWHGVAAIDSHIFSIGGNNGTDQLSSCEVFDVYSDDCVSQPIASLPTPLNALGVCASSNHVYAFVNRSTHIYDPQRDSWSNGPATIEKRTENAAWMDECVFAAGSASLTPSRTVEMWDTRSAGWQSLSDMQSARFRCRLAAVGDKLFALCGTSGEKMEVYDRRADAWRLTDTPNLSRDGAGVTVCEGRIVVAGGALPDTWDFIDFVKVLDGSEWRDVVCEGFEKRCYNGLCSVDGVLFSCGGYNGIHSVCDDIVCFALDL